MKEKKTISDLKLKVLLRISAASLIVVAAVLIGSAFFETEKNQVICEYPFNLSPFQTENGWGYQIKAKDKIIIYQDQIPCVKGMKAFKTSEDAIAVGNAVLMKLKENKLPRISLEEIHELGVSINH